MSEVADRRTDKAMAREPVGPPVGVDDVSPPQPKASRGGKRVVQPAAAVIVGVDVASGPDIAVEATVVDGKITSVRKVPMTQAERSAKHYEANREARKEANRLRMAEKRKRK